MTPAKIFQIRSLLRGLLNFREQPNMIEPDSNLASYFDDSEIKYSSSNASAVQAAQQEVGLIEIGPRLDIQAGIDLLTTYKNISQPIKAIRIDLQGAQTAHGAVIQTLLVIQKACEVSEKDFIICGLSSELAAFFHLAGLNGLLLKTQVVENI